MKNPLNHKKRLTYALLLAAVAAPLLTVTTASASEGRQSRPFQSLASSSKALPDSSYNREAYTEEDTLRGRYEWTDGKTTSETHTTVTIKSKTVNVTSNSSFRYTQPLALNKARAKSVAQAIANKHSLRLVWVAPDIHLKGPVTLLARSAKEDLMLLQKAIGKSGPLIMTISDRDNVMRVMSTDLLRKSKAYKDRAYAKADAESLDALNSRYKLFIGELEPLEDAILRFLSIEGYTLDWKIAGGFDANIDMYFEGPSIISVLSQILPPLGVSADVYTTDNHIVVRPGEPRDR